MVLEPRGRLALFAASTTTCSRSCDHSPVKLLGAVDQDRLEQLIDDDGFLAHMDRVEEAFDNYMMPRPGFRKPTARAARTPAGQSPYRSPTSAPSSASTRAFRSTPAASACSAGDHLKSASDLGLPLVGVGLMYREGYFRQYLTVDGWQQERYPENDFFNLPLIPGDQAGRHAALGQRAVPRPRGLVPRLAHPGRPRAALSARHQHPAEHAEDRTITARLYGGDNDMRIRQEMVLGIGGVRALRALGKKPTVCHMNEGHSAFCGLERIRLLMEENSVDFATAREAVAAGTCLHHAHAGAGRQRRLRRRS